MNLQGVNFARILITKDADYDFFEKKYSQTGILVEKTNFKNITYSHIPTILIGKSFVSLLKLNDLNIVSVIDIKNKEISHIENEINFLLDKLAYEFNPYELIQYDNVLDGDLLKFLSSVIDNSQYSFLYFYKKCLYWYYSDKLISINLESLLYVGNDFKSIIEKALLQFKCCVFSYDNFYKYISNTELVNLQTFENIVWCKEQEEIVEIMLFRHFGGIEIHRNIPYLMSVYVKQNTLSLEEEVSINNFYKKDVITKWMSKQDVFFNKKYQNLNLKTKTDNLFCCKINYSNKRTITGRINCKDEFFNIQMLPKNSEVRQHIISRYKGGKIIVFDYVSFESRIAIFLTENLKFINKLHNVDMHEYTGSIIFNKEILLKKERDVGKLFNHTLLYGGGEEKLKSIISESKNLSSEEFEQLFNTLKNKLSPIINLSKEIIKFQKETGYVINPYKTLIKPKKQYASFNNFIQSTASDIVIEKLFEIKNYIKNKNIKFLYQVYDSFVFDFDPSELHNIPALSELLSHSNQLTYPVQHKIGNNLMECGVEEYNEVEIF